MMKTKRFKGIALEVDAQGRPVESMGNYLAILQSGIAGKITRDLCSGEIIATTAPNQFTYIYDPSVLSKLVLRLEQDYGMRKVSTRNPHLLDAIACAAGQAEAYSQHKAWAETLVWDGVDRCEHSLIKWLKADDTDYNKEVSKLLYVTLAAKIMEINNAVVQPSCFTLIGAPGCGKTTFLRALAGRHSEWVYSLDSILTSKDRAETANALAAKLVCEAKECAAFAGAEARRSDAIKLWLDDAYAETRLPYDKRPVRLRKGYILVSASNHPKFLLDATNCRRFLPVHVHATEANGIEMVENHLDELMHWQEQCLAEALYKRYTLHLPDWQSLVLPAELAAEVTAERASIVADSTAELHMSEDELIRQALQVVLDSGLTRTTPNQIYSIVYGQVPEGKRVPQSKAQIITTVATAAGWVDAGKCKHEGISQRVFDYTAVTS